MNALNEFIEPTQARLEEIFRLYDSFMAANEAERKLATARDQGADALTVRELAGRFIQRPDSSSRIALAAALERFLSTTMATLMGSAMDLPFRVFLVEGARDQRACVEAARNLRKALARAPKIPGFTKRPQWARNQLESDLRELYTTRIRPAQEKTRSAAGDYIGSEGLSSPEPRKFARAVMDALGVKRETKRR